MMQFHCASPSLLLSQRLFSWAAKVLLYAVQVYIQKLKWRPVAGKKPCNCFFPTSRKDSSYSMELQHKHFILFCVSVILCLADIFFFLLTQITFKKKNQEKRLESNLFLALRPFYLYSRKKCNRYTQNYLVALS